MERVLVTGATGFLGYHIASALAHQGYIVRALVRRPPPANLAKLHGIEYARGELSQPETLLTATQNVDAVIHCAGVVKALHPDDYFKINAEGTQNLLDALTQQTHGIKRFVHVSSLAAIGPNVGEQLEIPIEQAQPVSTYGKSKLMAEQIIHKYLHQIPISIIRPPAIYGPYDKEFLIFFQLIKKRLWPSFMNKDKRFSLIYVEDAANAIIQTMQKDQDSGHTYFIDDDHHYSVEEIIEPLKKALNVKKVHQIFIPRGLLNSFSILADIYAKLSKKPTMLGKDKMRELKENNWTCNSHLAHKNLGWQAQTNWSAGVLKTLQWYQQQGWMRSE